MSLLGKAWRPSQEPAEHVTEVYEGDDGLWHWTCEDCPHLGYGNVRERITAAAARHALHPPRP